MPLDPQVASIVKALALTENGGRIDVNNPKSGQSGEMKSLFQFTPGTWKMYAKEISGDPNLPMNAQNESLVTYGKVHQWLQDGLKPEEIASIWNSGKPDAYLKDNKGTNKYGVKFDTPAYVKQFSEHLKQTGGNQPKIQSQAPQTSPVTQPLIQGNFATSQPIQAQAPQGKTLPELMQKQAKQPRQI